MKRLISAAVSEIQQMSSKEILESIAQSEGRVIACENVVACQPLLTDISNGELAASLGADILICNLFDVDNPKINGLPESENDLAMLKKLTGRIIGINLEPVEDIENSDILWKMSKGRIATRDNARKAKQLGVDFLCITGNPGNHVSNTAICNAIKEIKEELGDEIFIIAGKMHAAGILSEAADKIVDEKVVNDFIEAGADVILVPAPATVPGITLELIHQLTHFVHSKGKLVMSSIGTSQEGADEQTIRSIALMCKMAGVDIHHIGDAGYCGIAVPQNITAYSIAIRGVRHTYHKMAQSIFR